MAKIPLVEEEFWRLAAGLARYEVSNLGRLRDKLTKKPIKPRADAYGHLVFSAQCRDYVTTKRVARVVGESFGQLREGNQKLRVSYKDGNPGNCRPENLEWITTAAVWKKTCHARKPDTSD